MRRFTIDTKCLVGYDENGQVARDVEALVEAASKGEADIAMLASSSSEVHPGGQHLARFADFRKRMIDVGLGTIFLLPPLAKHGFTFPGFGVLGDEVTVHRERLVFKVLFPGMHSRWSDYAAAKGLDRKDIASPDAWKWRGRLGDVQAFWAHEYHRRDVFVTCDECFGRLPDHPEFSRARIVTPSQAMHMLTVSG